MKIITFFYQISFGTSIVSAHKNKVWKDLTKCVQTWEKRKRGSKRGYKAINNSRSHKYTKDYILIKLKGIPRKTAKTLKSGVKVKAGFPTPSWHKPPNTKFCFNYFNCFLYFYLGSNRIFFLRK